MTQPRGFTHPEPIEPALAAARDAWLAAVHAEGWTQRGEDVVRSMRTIWMHKPLPNLPAPLGPSESGVDFSHWNNGQQVIDFAKVRAAGHRFGWGKRSQGRNFTDPNGAANFNAARGKLDHIGNYHFFEWRQDGTEQANFFSLTCGEALGNLPELIDVELERWDIPANVVKSVAEANLRACLARCEIQFSRRPMIYTSAHYWRSMFDTNRVADIARDYKFLVADWTGPLDLPAGVAWAHFHQKSATHQIPGLAGDWDLDEYRGDPPPPPVFPYRARVRALSFLRDAAGNGLLTNGVQASVPAGAEVTVLEIRPSIGPNALGQVYENRAVLHTDGRSIWNANLERV